MSVKVFFNRSGHARRRGAFYSSSLLATGETVTARHCLGFTVRPRGFPQFRRQKKRSGLWIFRPNNESVILWIRTEQTWASLAHLTANKSNLEPFSHNFEILLLITSFIFVVMTVGASRLTTLPLNSLTYFSKNPSTIPRLIKWMYVAVLKLISVSELSELFFSGFDLVFHCNKYT